jgi:uncharacterized protein (DUF488 family)
VADRLYTVGHGTRPVEELVGMLRDARVQRLVDVRTAPGSRRNPQFAREALDQTLAAAGIDYEWHPDLGGFRKPRAESPHHALRNVSFRGYADYMDTPAFQRALTELEETSRATTTAIMCAERLWWRCHRRMIADALLVRGWVVVHLLNRDDGVEHVLHSAARVANGRPIYDVGEPASPRSKPASPSSLPAGP